MGGGGGDSGFTNYLQSILQDDYESEEPKPSILSTQDDENTVNHSFTDPAFLSLMRGLEKFVFLLLFGLF